MNITDVRQANPKKIKNPIFRNLAIACLALAALAPGVAKAADTGELPQPGPVGIAASCTLHAVGTALAFAGESVPLVATFVKVGAGESVDRDILRKVQTPETQYTNGAETNVMSAVLGAPLAFVVNVIFHGIPYLAGKAAGIESVEQSNLAYLKQTPSVYFGTQLVARQTARCADSE
jgi:hypothetical protein